MAPTTPTTRTFKCKCGEFQAKLTGEPLMDVNCYCHSCVACCRFVDEKHPGGTTGLKDDGAVFTAYKPSQIDFLGADLTDTFGLVKVGPKGKFYRLYTKCCGTLAIPGAMSKFVSFNRNGIYNQDGSPYVPAKPPLNLQKKNAFDPSLVPEPSHATFPMGMVCKIAMTMVNPFGGPKLKEKALVSPNEEGAEVVEITWE